MPDCIYCKSSFYDKSTLNKHQKRSKSCIEAQLRQQPDKVIECDIYECSYCKKQLSSKYSLNNHFNTCKVKKAQNERKETLEEKFEKLVKEVVQLKEKPQTINVTTTNNNSTNSNNLITNHNYSSLLDYGKDCELITKKFEEHYRMEHLLKGDQKQLANMTIQHLLSGEGQPMYYVADRSRNKFMFTDQENNEKEDPGAIVLRRLVYRALKPIIDKLYTIEFKKLNDSLAYYLRLGVEDMIPETHKDIKELQKSYEKTKILGASDDYVSQLSRCLPSSIKDRIFRDSVDGFDMCKDDSTDATMNKELAKAARMICGYTANELEAYKDSYKINGKVCGPNGLDITDKKYIDFLNEDDN